MTIEFSVGSRLKELDCSAKLIINNEHFITRNYGVVLSLHQPGIVFVPESISEFEIDQSIEVIYSYAFHSIAIKDIYFPKSLKKICNRDFDSSMLRSVTFEEGTNVLDSLDMRALKCRYLNEIKLPLIKGRFAGIEHRILSKLEFPSSFDVTEIVKEIYTIFFKETPKVVCSRLSLPSVFKIDS